MALYAFFRNNPNPTAEQVEEAMDGMVHFAWHMDLKLMWY